MGLPSPSRFTCRSRNTCICRDSAHCSRCRSPHVTLRKTVHSGRLRAENFPLPFHCKRHLALTAFSFQNALPRTHLLPRYSETAFQSNKLLQLQEGIRAQTHQPQSQKRESSPSRLCSFPIVVTKHLTRSSLEEGRLHYSGLHFEGTQPIHHARQGRGALRQQGSK